MKETKMFCTRSTLRPYSNFYKNPRAFSLVGVSLADIIPVLVRETKDPGQDSYWAWWDNNDQEFDFIFPVRSLVECCFPYGSRVEAELGHGEMCRVDIIELEKE